MSRTTRKQAEWTLHRALDGLIEEGPYPLATDDIVVQSVEERIIVSVAANTALPPLALMYASRGTLGEPASS